MTKTTISLVSMALLVSIPFTAAFVPHQAQLTRTFFNYPNHISSCLFASNNDNGSREDGLSGKFGGYTVKQRLREEVESPFRKVRFGFFAFSAVSAFIALYFSALGTLKAVMGSFADAPLLEEAIQSDAINLAGLLVCGYLAMREYRIGEANLERIAKGGALARLVVEPAMGGRQTLASYRRAARVLIAAGGPSYITELARSLNSDQLADANIIPEKLAESEVVVVPVLLKGNDDKISAVETKDFWLAVDADEKNRNFDIARSNQVVAFPRDSPAWTDYLKSEIETASGQGFDVMDKGITITVKKNGRILRRATGQPPFTDFLGMMEVMDGSKFGMPGDSERYGGL